MTTRTPCGAKNYHSGTTSCKEGKRTVSEKQFEEKKAKGWSSGPAVCKKGNEDGCLVRPSSLPLFCCKQTYGRSEEG